jgi:hypothetical protein
VGALIARAICKKFTVSHTLLSGRPSRVCALPALRGHCADCGLCGLAGLRSPVCARGPFRRFAPTREPRCRERGGRSPHRRPARSGAGPTGKASPRPRPPPTLRQRPQRAPPRRRPLRGHWSASSRESGQCASGSDSSYSGCVLRTVPLRRTAAPNRRAGARRDPGRTGTASDRRGAGVDG